MVFSTFSELSICLVLLRHFSKKFSYTGRVADLTVFAVESSRVGFRALATVPLGLQKTSQEVKR